MDHYLIMGYSLFIYFFSNIIKILKKKNKSFLFYNLLSLIFILVFFYRLAEHGTDRSAQILSFILITEIY